MECECQPTFFLYQTIIWELFLNNVRWKTHLRSLSQLKHYGAYIYIDIQESEARSFNNGSDFRVYNKIYSNKKIEIITSDQTYEQEGNSKIDMILHR